MLDATIACIVEFGFVGATTTTIVKRAGLSQGALFKHFPNKAVLMAAAAERLFVELIAGYRLAISTLAAEQIDDVAERVDVAIERLWVLFQQPQLQASIELYTAARTDTALATALRPILVSHSANIIAEGEGLFPELARHDDFAMVITGIIGSMLGAALTAPIKEQPQGSAAERAFVARVAGSECQRLLEELGRAS
ncbi:TetR/AcrR family transcriptional regulator [Desulfobulbus sp. AH-315-M07]|nr:TetR/AcrR family transcriptional regulator [Desulfobulbus sp. AH-315-M07]